MSRTADRGAAAEAGEFRIVKTAAGYCWYVAGPQGLKRCSLPERTRAAALEGIRRHFPEARESRSLLPGLARDLEAFFRGERVGFDVELDETGLTPFRRDVYRALRRVAFGRTTTYGELAASAGRAGAARGVGMAMAKNPFPPIVPCHRVLAANGALCGFSATGGLDLKRRMIALEAGDS